MKTWKQVKLFVADRSQSVIIENDPSYTSVQVHIAEEEQKDKSFLLYLTYEEARDFAHELNVFLDEAERGKKK